jgi:hypothetical protein
MMIQLDPPIPMDTEKGKGHAILAIDYSQDHDILWVIAMNDTGEIWCMPNPKVRACINFSLGRMAQSKIAPIVPMVPKQ